MRHADLAKLTTQLKRHEGTKRNDAGQHIAYRCTAGALTIGWGHNLDANPVPGIGEALSDDQAERLLRADIAAVRESIAIRLPWTGSLTPPRYAVIVNMAFNLGMFRLLGFTNTLALIRRGDYHSAAANMLKSKWAAQVGKRATELARQMETGAWQ